MFWDRAEVKRRQTAYGSPQGEHGESINKLTECRARSGWWLVKRHSTLHFGKIIDSKIILEPQPSNGAGARKSNRRSARRARDEVDPIFRPPAV
jgi:hypothetical protein